jgi:hypothetical protein
VENELSEKGLVEVMRRYFEMKDEVSIITKELEALRIATGEAMEIFYRPVKDMAHFPALLRSHSLKRDMARLMLLAEKIAKA